MFSFTDRLLGFLDIVNIILDNSDTVRSRGNRNMHPSAARWRHEFAFRSHPLFHCLYQYFTYRKFFSLWKYFKDGLANYLMLLLLPHLFNDGIDIRDPVSEIHFKITLAKRIDDGTRLYSLCI